MLIISVKTIEDNSLESHWNLKLGDGELIIISICDFY